MRRIWEGWLLIRNYSLSRSLGRFCLRGDGVTKVANYDGFGRERSNGSVSVSVAVE